MPIVVTGQKIPFPLQKDTLTFQGPEGSFLSVSSSVSGLVTQPRRFLRHHLIIPLLSDPRQHTLPQEIAQWTWQPAASYWWGWGCTSYPDSSTVQGPMLHRRLRYWSFSAGHSGTAAFSCACGLGWLAKHCSNSKRTAGQAPAHMAACFQTPLPHSPRATSFQTVDRNIYSAYW